MVLSGMEFPHTVVLSGCLEKRVCDMKRRMVGLCMDFTLGLSFFPSSALEEGTEGGLENNGAPSAKAEQAAYLPLTYFPGTEN